MPSLHSCRIPWTSVFVLISASPTFAAVVFPASGTSSTGHPVSFQASLEISGNTLTIDLENTSPQNSIDASDVLSSFYFDITDGVSRPSLTLMSGSGFVYQVRKNTNDLEYFYTPQTFTQVSGIPSNLKAIASGDKSWQFRAMNTAAAPLLGFGIGTVGNSGLSPNGFTPAVVGPPGSGMIDFAIYKGGDIDPVGALDNRYLVKNKATFVFAGVNGYSEATVVDRVVFGLGTAPDSTITVSLPEPSAWALGTAALFIGYCLRHQPRRPGGG
ncbi:MAG: hypothetical protein K8S94_13135 [Planctomycetia bacterium]|nr:hypothetical protein [Planctomycetia bacterium]